MLQGRALAILILLGVCVTTALNRFVVTDINLQWQVSQVSFSIYLVLFAFYFAWTYRKWYSLAIFIIFFSELVGTIAGFNLSTQFFPELIICFGIFGLYTIFKNV